MLKSKDGIYKILETNKASEFGYSYNFTDDYVYLTNNCDTIYVYDYPDVKYNNKIINSLRQKAKLNVSTLMLNNNIIRKKHSTTQYHDYIFPGGNIFICFEMDEEDEDFIYNKTNTNMSQITINIYKIDMATSSYKLIHYIIAPFSEYTIYKMPDINM